MDETRCFSPGENTQLVQFFDDIPDGRVVCGTILDAGAAMMTCEPAVLNAFVRCTGSSLAVVDAIMGGTAVAVVAVKGYGALAEGTADSDAAKVAHARYNTTNPVQYHAPAGSAPSHPSATVGETAAKTAVSVATPLALAAGAAFARQQGEGESVRPPLQPSLYCNASAHGLRTALEMLQWCAEESSAAQKDSLGTAGTASTARPQVYIGIQCMRMLRVEFTALFQPTVRGDRLSCRIKGETLAEPIMAAVIDVRSTLAFILGTKPFYNNMSYCLATLPFI